MTKFITRDFLLETDTARRLYHDYAAALPLVDYHCHISPQEICEDRRFDNLAQVWLGGRKPDGTYFGDHYKWRIMRANGVDESYVTGDRPGFDRFLKFAEALQLTIGNPMYHWCNLELHHFFGIESCLTPGNALEIWDRCNDMLRHHPDLTVRGIIRKSNVEMIGTTDDPVDNLEWHRKLAADPTFSCKVYPSYRPDKAIQIEKPGFQSYMDRLAASVGKSKLETVKEVEAALVERLAYFSELGCRASDHGLDYVVYRPGKQETVEAAYQKALSGQSLTVEEVEQYQTEILLALGRAYHQFGIAMQLHFSCLRNVNARMYASLGPDSGFDIMGDTNSIGPIASLLSALDDTGECPKTLLYSSNPKDNAALDALIGAFQGPEVPGKIQHGSAWWFNDTKRGMEEHLRLLASQGILGNFIGMLTDSRSFLSYTRHDYFRRILCNLIGEWVENGEYPKDETALKTIVEGICYHNAARYFALDET